MRAVLKNYRQSPRKVRLIANLVRGKDADKVLTTLSFLPKRAAFPMQKLIKSALANAKHTKGKNPSDLVLKNMEVNEGITFKRVEYRARGSSNIIKKRTSRISVELADKEAKRNKEEDGKKVSDNTKAQKAK